MGTAESVAVPNSDAGNERFFEASFNETLDRYREFLGAERDGKVSLRTIFRRWRRHWAGHTN